MLFIHFPYSVTAERLLSEDHASLREKVENFSSFFAVWPCVGVKNFLWPKVQMYEMCAHVELVAICNYQLVKCLKRACNSLLIDEGEFDEKCSEN